MSSFFEKKFFWFAVCYLGAPSLFATTLTVNAAGDGFASSGGFFAGTSGDLRGVLNHINQTPDTYFIDFGLGLSIIRLQAPLPIINLNSANMITIDGTNGGSPITVDGNADFSGFFVRQGTVTLQHLTLKDVIAIGGNGQSGGGGGMGAGGALFIDQANVILEDVSIDTTFAIGGAGSKSIASHRGGGAGMGGNGGNSTLFAGGGGGLGSNSAGAVGGAGGLGNNLGYGGGGGIDGGENHLGSGAVGGGNAGATGGGIGGSAAGNSGLGVGSGGASGGGGGSGVGSNDAGGGGGNAGSSGSGNLGGNGGYGGGGGGGVIGGNGDLGGGGGGGDVAGGSGGFGGGGGSGLTGGAGGFGGGGGSINGIGGVGGRTNGGGGAAFGAGIFVKDAGSLTIMAPFSFSTAFLQTTPGGSGPGWSAGLGAFFMQGSAVTLDPNSSIINFGYSIADDSPFSFTGAPAGITKGNSSGAVLNIGGSGGAGVVNLTAANTYSGGTNLNKGFLGVGNNTALGSGTLTFMSIANNVLLPIAPNLNIGNPINLKADGIIDTNATNMTLSGVITGDPLITLTKIGFGVLTLTAASSYPGGTFITSDTLSLAGAGALSPSAPVSVTATFDISRILSSTTIGDLTGSGFVSLGSKTLAFGASAGSTFSGILQDGGIGGGTGGKIIKQGSGTTVLSAANTFTGGTTINAGQLTVTGSIGGSVTVNDSAIFSVQNSFVIGNLSGSSGATVSIVGGNTLTFGTSASTQFAGNISSSGHLVKQGTGVFTASGTSSFTGIFDVNSGTFNITGSFPPTSTTNVALGATLKGTGTLDIVNLSGTVMPGNSIGTLNVGNFTFNSGSTYLAELSNTASDLINSSATVTINSGATLKLSGSGLISPQLSYLIINASTAVVKNADFIFINPFARFSFSVQYNANDVRLLLSGSIIDFTATGNGAGVARCFNTLLQDPPSDLIPVIDVLNFQTIAEWQDSFNQMQPSLLDNIAYGQENVAERIRQSFSNHLCEKRFEACPLQQPYQLWFAPFFEHVHQYGKSENHGYKENFRGFTAAADYRLMQHWILTTGFSYADSDVGSVRTHGDFKTFAGSAGALWNSSHFFADALFSYLYSKVHAKRKMHFVAPDVPSVSRAASHHHNASQVMGHLEGGYDFTFNFGTAGNLILYPFIDIDYIYVMQEGYRESGAQSLDLHVKSKNYDLLRPEAGVGLGYAGCFDDIEIKSDVSLSYIREQRLLGKKTHARFKSSSCQFTVEGLNPDNNLIAPSARISLSSKTKTPVTFTVGYHGEFGSNFVENVAEAALMIAF